MTPHIDQCAGGDLLESHGHWRQTVLLMLVMPKTSVTFTALGEECSIAPKMNPKSMVNKMWEKRMTLILNSSDESQEPIFSKAVKAGAAAEPNSRAEANDGSNCNNGIV